MEKYDSKRVLIICPGQLSYTDLLYFDHLVFPIHAIGSYPVDDLHHKDDWPYGGNVTSGTWQKLEDAGLISAEKFLYRLFSYSWQNVQLDILFKHGASFDNQAPSVRTLSSMANQKGLYAVPKYSQRDFRTLMISGDNEVLSIVYKQLPALDPNNFNLKRFIDFLNQEETKIRRSRLVACMDNVASSIANGTLEIENISKILATHLDDYMIWLEKSGLQLNYEKYEFLYYWGSQKLTIPNLSDDVVKYIELKKERLKLLDEEKNPGRQLAYVFHNIDTYSGKVDKSRLDRVAIRKSEIIDSDANKHEGLVMSRKEFPEPVVISVLVKCRRHCCVCDKFCGQKIEIHHIGDPSDDSEDNALPVCFDCHAEVRSYNKDHPKGRKYRPEELKKLREQIFAKYSGNFPVVSSNSDYGLGFHDGVKWAEKSFALKNIWRFVSLHGDFALEILIHFEGSDTCSMMDETFFADVDTGMEIPQDKGYRSAWSDGEMIGLWGVDPNEEILFITELGKIYRDLVQSSGELKSRYEQLREFWKNQYSGSVNQKKPSMSQDDTWKPFPAGIMNWLQMEVFKLIRISDQKSDVYFIRSVTPEKLELVNLESGDLREFSDDEIKNVELDRKSGELILILKSI